MVEYVIITAAIMGGLVMSWPFTIELLRALNTYYQSIYLVLAAPLP